MVFIDSLRVWGAWRWGESCHMLPHDHTDLALEELHQFALTIGLKREWFQPGRWPHYDLTAARRERALVAGAVETCSKAYIRRLREEAQTNHR